MQTHDLITSINIFSAIQHLVTLVTGGAGGLGRATATRFVKKGSKVVFCDLPTSDGEEVAKELGENAHFIPADVTSETEIQNVLSEISKKHGKLDVVVNCAGLSNAFVIYNFKTRKARSIEDFKSVLEVNLLITCFLHIKNPKTQQILKASNHFCQANVLGTYNVSRLAAGLIAKNEPDENGLKGVIVNTSGVEATRGSGGQVVSAAACGAIQALTQSLAADFTPEGIRVVAISPGLIKTKLCDHYPKEVEDAIANECILAPHRMGHPDEFAYAVQSIVSNPYFNATTIELSAGLNFSI